MKILVCEVEDLPTAKIGPYLISQSPYNAGTKQSLSFCQSISPQSLGDLNQKKKKSDAAYDEEVVLAAMPLRRVLKI